MKKAYLFFLILTIPQLLFSSRPLPCPGMARRSYPDIHEKLIEKAFIDNTGTIYTFNREKKKLYSFDKNGKAIESYSLSHNDFNKAIKYVSFSNNNLLLQSKKELLLFNLKDHVKKYIKMVAEIKNADLCDGGFLVHTSDYCYTRFDENGNDTWVIKDNLASYKTIILDSGNIMQIYKNNWAVSDPRNCRIDTIPSHSLPAQFQDVFKKELPNENLLMVCKHPTISNQFSILVANPETGSHSKLVSISSKNKLIGSYKRKNDLLFAASTHNTCSTVSLFDINSQKKSYEAEIGFKEIAYLRIIDKAIHIVGNQNGGGKGCVLDTRIKPAN